MNPTTEKVIQRLVYEKLLLTESVRAQRRPITLEEMIDAGKEEPRVYAILPAIILYKPSIISNLKKDIKKYPFIHEFTANLFKLTSKSSFYGVDRAECQKAAHTYREFLRQKKTKLKSVTLNLRLGVDDVERFQRLTDKLDLRSVSETIRYLAREKEKQIVHDI